MKVVFKSSNYLKGTMLVYGMPALMLIIGAVLGKEYLSRFFPAADPDFVSRQWIWLSYHYVYGH